MKYPSWVNYSAICFFAAALAIWYATYLLGRRREVQPMALAVGGQPDLKSYGMTLLGKTKSDDYPNGLALEFVVKAKKANKPSDASAIIEQEVKLDKLQLKSTRDFYIDVVIVMDKYEVTKTDHKLCMLMAWKNIDASYARLILAKLKSSSPDFDRLCNEISETQRLTQSGS